MAGKNKYNFKRKPTVRFGCYHGLRESRAEASYGEDYFSEEKEGNSISKPQQVASTNTRQ
jgi:hypothetical protein